MAIDLLSIELRRLDAEQRMACLDALKIPDSPLKMCQGNVTFGVNVVHLWLGGE